jgi:hypothetical protein
VDNYHYLENKNYLKDMDYLEDKDRKAPSTKIWTILGGMLKPLHRFSQFLASSTPSSSLNENEN